MLKPYKYAIALLVTLGIVAVYHFVNIRLFSLDITKMTRENLFYIRTQPAAQEEMLMLNIGRLEAGELKPKLDSLLLSGPTVVGVNLCHYTTDMSAIVKQYAAVPNIFFVDCRGRGRGALSEIINEGNVVTHFDCYRRDYFEFLLTGFKPRGNDREMINYAPEQQSIFMRAELKDAPLWYGALEGKTILVGYMGDYLTDSLYYYQQCRITPLNEYYGQENLLPDLYDTEVSANIIRTIRDQDYIDEIGEVYRILILLAFALLNVIIITFVRTKWLAVNLIIAGLIFVLFTIAGSVSLVLLFDKGYFLDLDELPVILLITTVFTMAVNFPRKQKDATAEPV
ncbi:hypothetical protein [Chryseolinea soli]|uniref:CHASE2 domain-containing protein n=1 Tax=Chryseolinea soli TaxID=2321403 RepID=A0A385SWD9_9BACT|nr:hypothetical protein [Chryseolinea soli]AYB34601.1 hypothetical protein D4L85_30235 [Chryseolinea soli]